LSGLGGERIRRQPCNQKIADSIPVQAYFVTPFGKEYNLAMLTMAAVASPLWPGKSAHLIRCATVLVDYAKILLPLLYMKRTKELALKLKFISISTFTELLPSTSADLQVKS